MAQAPVALQVSTLPQTPGVYQYYDKNGQLLYIGKAKNLKKRVGSYFNKTHEIARTRILVKQIVDIKHIVVATETDALLLENNLIKKYQPKYNILLKDDKTYPWICIKKERFPRVFSTRRLIKDGSEYFGPYTNFKTVYTLLDIYQPLKKPYCSWCPRPDSNWPSVNRRRILSPLCLPIPPRGLIGLPCRIRTYDLQLRRLLLYPAELRAVSPIKSWGPTPITGRPPGRYAISS